MEQDVLQGLKTRQMAAWGSGDYAVIGTTLQVTGELLAEACDLRYGESVLDVAAGNGNATLAAARRGCVVTSTDYVGGLLERAAERARAERLQAHFQVADAEALPFPDETFDAVLSTFGVMFTPRQELAAAELFRVCNRHGRVGLANWTPEGFIGKVFRILGKYLPPPEGVKSPSLWGTKERIQQLFPVDAAHINIRRAVFNFRYKSPKHFVEVFRTWYGPIHKAFAALSSDQANHLDADLIQLLHDSNCAGPHSLVVPSEYLEIVIRKS